jgi:RNA polymerase sigma-70 factor (ECF subfamily)
MPVTDLPYTPSHQEFERLFFATKDRLYYFISKFIKNEQAAEDLLQNCYLLAWQNFNSITDKENILPLLYTYAKRLTIKAVLREAKRKQVETACAPEEYYNEELQRENRELGQLVDKAIASLPARKQQVFRLKREENLSYGQIAERLNISTNTVANHMSEALDLLRRELKKEQVTLLVSIFIAAMPK